jgi:hypothetical protein
VARQVEAIVTALDEVLSLAAGARADHANAARARVQSSYALVPWATRLADLYDETLRR